MCESVCVCISEHLDVSIIMLTHCLGFGGGERLKCMYIYRQRLH